MSIQWKPSEIIVHENVINDPDTVYFISQCPGIPIKYVSSADAKGIVQASDVLRAAGAGMLNKVLTGKSVVFIAPGNNSVDEFTIPDDRFICPHFERLKLASNGCFYMCDWCYLKLTYRAQRPFITIRVQYDKIKQALQKRLNKTSAPIFFNSGELADSLSMEHLTRAGHTFIPWFGQSQNGYLFMLTKSDNVDDILNLQHNGHTVIAWSMNNDRISRKFEIGAPSFDQRLEAAWKVQQAGYPVRIRLDPIVPFDGWEAAYASTVQRIFTRIIPERITLGTLRFEKGFYDQRQRIFTTGSELPGIIETLRPMFELKMFEGKKRPKEGKYSYSEDDRVRIFDFIIKEIQKYSPCTIALCKESAEVWNRLGLDLSRVQCVCQLDSVDMT